MRSRLSSHAGHMRSIRVAYTDGMASPRVAFVAPLLLAGCSLIYNPNNLPDPRVIDAAVVDANPCALVIDDVAPKIIDEGQGAGGSVPALVVLHGNNIVNANLKIELKAKNGSTVTCPDRRGRSAAPRRPRSWSAAPRAGVPPARRGRPAS